MREGKPPKSSDDRREIHACSWYGVLLPTLVDAKMWYLECPALAQRMGAVTSPHPTRF
jgi:hypothetical protein